jgi:hypothetical protein
MTETFEQYTNRLLSYSKGKDPLKVHQATPDKLSRLLKGLKKSQLLKRPSPEKWSLAEILAHLSEGELVIGYRLRTVLNSNGTSIQAYDQNSWVKNSFYLRDHPAEALELFKIIRKNNIALIRSIPKKMWSFYGIHSERGKETIDRMLKMVAGHDLNHLMAIERDVKKIRKR